MERLTLTTGGSKDYELLDSGGEEKLERYGSFLLARPDPQALWPKHLSEAEWQKANARYIRQGEKGEWIMKSPNPPSAGWRSGWQIEFGGLQFLIKPTSFKHVGLFPEQLSNWEWVTKLIRSSNSKISGERKFPADKFARPRAVALDTLPQPSFASAPAVLNLFGYTGGATLAAASAGAEVCHVDASKTAVAWARENAEASGLADKPVRWIVEDALVFVKREIQRGKRYDGIIMDPPAFGHGPNNELWKIEEDFVELVGLCGQLLSNDPLFFLINGYAAGYSPLAFAYNLEFLTKKYGGSIEYGDLMIAENNSERILPCGIFARWKK